jgi:o-succinylbenzoate synthase
MSCGRIFSGTNVVIQSVDVSKYVLVDAMAPAGPRRPGALLRLRFKDGATGFADLCPFPQFGDRELSDELQTLKHLLGGQERPPSRLLQQSLLCARWDADARAKGLRLTDGPRIKNHLLIRSLLDLDVPALLKTVSQEFRTLKIKLGQELELETAMLMSLLERLPPDIRVRLDFNSRLTPDRFLRWTDHLHRGIESTLALNIEWIEDPVPYDPVVWRALKEKTPWALAVDFGLEAHDFELGGAAVLVLKPAIQNVDQVLDKTKHAGLDYSVTHYMDFAFGQMYAYARAQSLWRELGPRLRVCGLQDRDIHVRSEFQGLIQNQGDEIIPPPGLGLGFDQALDDETWSPL